MSLEKQMKGYGEYRALIELPESLSLDIQELSNLNNVIAKLIGEWKGPHGTLRLFITLLEKPKRKSKLKNSLKNTARIHRKSKYQIK